MIGTFSKGPGVAQKILLPSMPPFGFDSSKPFYIVPLLRSMTLVPLLVSLLLWQENKVHAWITPTRRIERSSALDAAVGIFYGTSTGSTQTVADAIYDAFGSDLAAEPVDVDALENGQLAQLFAEHGALIVGTPTWNTGADTERSGTGWDELYYTKLPELKGILQGKKVAVFGLGDQISYSENYADAAGELFDVFEGLGCQMLGAWSMEGYEHEASKSIRGDKFCGLLLDMVNQEELTNERVQRWVDQLKGEGILGREVAVSSVPAAVRVEDESIVNGEVPAFQSNEVTNALDENSALLDQSIATHSYAGFTPHLNSMTGKIMWTSPDGRKSFVTTVETTSRWRP